ncbi:MAG: outer membrane beta-barrel protein [Gemmatimonadaceae bacterium]
MGPVERTLGDADVRSDNPFFLWSPSMLRKMFAVAGFALIAPVAMAQAQISFGIGAGASIPNGDFANGIETGYHLLATVGVHPPLAPVGFRVDGMFNQFKGESPSTSKLNLLGVNANAVLSMPGAIVLSPYLIGGVGMYRSSISPKITGVDAETDLGVNIGAGIKFGLAGFGAFGEISLHNIMGDDGAGNNVNSRFIPITFGIMF